MFGVEFFLPDLITIVMFDRPPLCQYDYSFRTEHSAAARLPPSPTRTSLSSEAWGSSPNISQTTLSPMEPSRRDLYTTTEDLHTTNSPKHMYWEEKKNRFCGSDWNYFNIDEWFMRGNLLSRGKMERNFTHMI